MIRAFALALSLSTLAFAAAGCESHDAAAASAPATPHQATTGGPSPADHDLCVQMMDRSRDCKAVFIPAIVDARAAVDHPAGIAAEVKANRDSVIAQANAEYVNDSTDAAIDVSCSKPMPQADLDQDRVSAQGCLAQADCAAFVSCELPLITKHFHE